MPINSRAKGSSFERHVAKLFIDAFAHKGITKEDCYRTPGSGGHQQYSKVDPGDLKISDRFAKLLELDLAVECKFHRRVELIRLMQLNGKKGPIQEWWSQAVKAAGDKKIPLLVFKQNNGEILAMYRLSDELHGEPHHAAYLRPYVRTYIGDDQVRVVRLVRLLGLWNFCLWGTKKWLKS